MHDEILPKGSEYTKRQSLGLVGYFGYSPENIYILFNIFFEIFPLINALVYFEAFCEVI